MRSLILPTLLFGFLPTVASAAEPDPLLPDDAEIVATLHLRQLTEAPLVKQHFPAGLGGLIAKESAWGRLTQTLGVDLLADVKTVVYARPATLDPAQGLLILRGAFDREKSWDALVKRAEKEPETVKVLAVKSTDSRYVRIVADGWTVFAAFLDKETLVLSEKEDAVVAACTRRGRPKLFPALKEQLAAVDDARTLWVVALVSDRLKKELTAGAEVDAILKSVHNVRGGVTVNEGIAVDFLIRTDNARAAGEARKLVDGFKGLLSVAAVSREGPGTLWPDLVSALKVAATGDAVTVQGAVTAEQIGRSLRNKRPE